MSIQFGATYRDRITGFQGVATGQASYISGCSQALIAPPAKDGSFVDPQWFDIQRLEPVQAPVISLDNTETPGCDRQAPKR